MSNPSDRESYAVVSSESDRLLLEGYTLNDCGSVSIRKLSAPIPIETGTIEAVGMDDTYCE